MQNEEGQITELYIPRKCSATNRLIASKDHASVQINVGHLDESGVYNGNFSTFALSGYIRAQGGADSALLLHKSKDSVFWAKAHSSPLFCLFSHLVQVQVEVHTQKQLGFSLQILYYTVLHYSFRGGQDSESSS